MPQSFSQMYVHLVFSTKERHPYFRDCQLREKMHRYLAGTLKGLDCDPMEVGGFADHVHLLFSLAATKGVAEIVRDLKRSSSRLVRQTEGAMFSKFSWQSGYGAFSVSASNREVVKKYILKQEEHHRELSFKDEFQALLIKHGLEYDTRYLWD